MVEVKYRSRMARLLRNLSTGNILVFDEAKLEYRGWSSPYRHDSFAIHHVELEEGVAYKIVGDAKEVDLPAPLVVEFTRGKTRSLSLKTQSQEGKETEEVNIRLLPETKVYYIINLDRVRKRQQIPSKNIS
ncbi:MAG: hypothetical protein HY513_05960 [Candidatus Aenigmarchaeota archaeon]|nr:hypothetical protein [Candidatus Aenigmarchaeota archaeon]